MLVVGAAAVAIVALLAATRDERAEPIPVATGTIYSTDAGDPLDVVAGIDEDGVCMNVGGLGYGSSISCTDEQGADETGTYMVVLPVSGTGPAFVVGVLPVAAIGATVESGSEALRAETRGRWFLAEFPEGADGSDVVVDFYT